jgi:endo-alpha-1,4-polygalactosaminidase (GH114 family)
MFISRRNLFDKENIPMKLEENMSYKIYYGSMDESIINDLLLYDMVIVEPLLISDKDLLKLQNAGVVVIGYQSMLEVGLWDKDILNNLNSEDILIQQTENRGPTANPNSLHYKKLWISEYKKRIENRGFDGVFLDTIDHVTLIDDKLRDEVILATINWIGELKMDFPEMLIIQNRGFDVFLQGSAAFIDGLLWENFDSSRIESEVYYEQLVLDTNVLSKKFGVRIMALNRINNVENTAFCKDSKWLHSYVPSGTYSNYYFDKQNTLDWIYNGIIDVDWVLTKKMWFVEDGTLDKEIIYQAKQKDIKMYLILDVSEINEEEILSYNLEYINDNVASILNNTTENYVDYFLTKIKFSREMGYEGILIDGVKNWYNVSTQGSPSRNEIYQGYTNLLKEIREEFPDINIYQNEGIMVIDSKNSEYLDGFVWEDFANSLYSESEWQQLQIKQLRDISKEVDWNIYIFSGEKPEEINKYCVENKYIYIH